MAQIALDVQNNAPQDPLVPATAHIPSSYTEALDILRARGIVEKAAWFSIFIILSLPYRPGYE